MIRKILTGLMSLAVLGCVLATGASGAAAAPSPAQGLQLAAGVASAASPAAAYKALTPAQHAVMDAAVMPVKVELARTGLQPSAIRLAQSGCWDAYARYNYKAAAGNTVYTAWQGLTWCGSGGRITSYHVFDRGGETSTPGWSYTGHGGSGSRNVGWEVRQYTQEKFTFGIGQYGFTQTRCLQVRGGATGLYSTRSDCVL